MPLPLLDGQETLQTQSGHRHRLQSRVHALPLPVGMAAGSLGSSTTLPPNSNDTSTREDYHHHQIGGRNAPTSSATLNSILTTTTTTTSSTTSTPCPPARVGAPRAPQCLVHYPLEICSLASPPAPGGWAATNTWLSSSRCDAYGASKA